MKRVVGRNYKKVCVVTLNTTSGVTKTEEFQAGVFAARKSLKVRMELGQVVSGTILHEGAEEVYVFEGGRVTCARRRVEVPAEDEDEAEVQ